MTNLTAAGREVSAIYCGSTISEGGGVQVDMLGELWQRALSGGELYQHRVTPRGELCKRELIRIVPRNEERPLRGRFKNII
jgi:hypothetical protein